jgi:phosphatidylglycerol:prolipoprotein diacylglycerol transferase
MYPTLPFGPLALPTGPILTILAVMLTLDIAGRMGRRHGLHPDDLWNVGLIALAAGLIVARLWNVFQFWYIYGSEPLLIFSIRPSGFAFWPGVVAALLGAYGYMLRRALDPIVVTAALLTGAAAGSVVMGIAGYATGSVLGAVGDAPTALLYFGELRHPVGLYRAVGGILLTVVLWWSADPRRPGRTVLLALLGFSLIYLVGDAFLAPGPAVAGIRISQIVALLVALATTWQLARAGSAAADAPAPLGDPESAPQR